MAPVMSSVTCALIVRSPSARSPISFSSRRIASWLRLFSLSASRRLAARVGEEHQRHEDQHQHQQPGEDGDRERAWPPASRPGSLPAVRPTARLQLLGGGNELARPPGARSRASAARAGSVPRSARRRRTASSARASLARASASRSALMPSASLPLSSARMSSRSVVGVLADEERHLRVDHLRAQDLRRAAAQALGEEGEAVGAQHLARRRARLRHEAGELLRQGGHLLRAHADLRDVLREGHEVALRREDRGGRLPSSRASAGRAPPGGSSASSVVAALGTSTPKAKPPFLQDLRGSSRTRRGCPAPAGMRACWPRAARPAALARRCVWNCICEAIVTYVALRVRARRVLEHQERGDGEQQAARGCRAPAAAAVMGLAPMIGQAEVAPSTSRRVPRPPSAVAAATPVRAGRPRRPAGWSSSRRPADDGRVGGFGLRAR